MKIDKIGNPQPWQMSSISMEIKSKHFCDPVEPCKWCQVYNGIQEKLDIYNRQLTNYKSETYENMVSIHDVIELQELFIQLLPEVRAMEREMWKHTAKGIEHDLSD